MEERMPEQGQKIKNFRRRIVFFGDSNTYGYEPSEVMPGRYPADVRWIDRLAGQLGNEWEVVPFGLNGRKIPDVRRSDQIELLERVLRICGEHGLLAVMLGTNDIALTSVPDADTAIAKMDRLLAYLTEKKAPGELLIIGPPAVKPEEAGPVAFFLQFSRENSRMNAAFRELADRYGTRFIDAGAWDIPMAYDMFHLSPEGHRKFAEHIQEAIMDLLAGTTETTQKYTMDQSLIEILAKAGPEMQLYFMPDMMELIPEEYRGRPLKEWAADFRMPWGMPFPADDVIGDANMLLNADEHREVIPLWDPDHFCITGNNIHSVCLLRLKTCLEGVRPCVIVVPGGGYENISFHNEGYTTARRLAAAGYRPFILNYRFKPNHYPDPQLDLALAIRYLRANAEKYQIDPDNLMILGYSAGGHLCASTAALRDEIDRKLTEELEKRRPDLAKLTSGISIRPDKVCLCYPVISFVSEDHEPSFQALTGGDESLRAHLSVESHVDPDYPKTFVWTCADDSLVPPSNAVRMGEALKAQGIPSMLKVYPTGEHGCHVGDGTSAEGWMKEMLAFME